jgi:dCMP deaminase
MKDPQKLFKDLVFRFAEQSKCKSRQVGAIIVKDGHLVAEGWNGAPSGSTCEQCPRPKCNGGLQSSGAGLDQAICCHAEANAIGNCAKRGITTHGASLYCTTFPCAECSKLIVAAGISQVVYSVKYPSPLSELILINAGVQVEQMSEDTCS